MAMSRTHYVAIARAVSDGALINCATEPEVQMNLDTRRKIAHQIADVMAEDNYAFDRARFLKACGVT